MGAFLIGFALVGGTYVVTNFGQAPAASPTNLTAAASEAPVRLFVPVSDSDADGVEDWQDQFVKAPAVVVSDITEETYTPPTTLTGQMGVSLMEDLLLIKGGGPLAKTEDQAVQNIVDRVESSSALDTLYDVKDVIVVRNNSNETVRAYGNALASIVLTYSDANLDHELLLLQDYVNQPEKVDNSKLLRLAEVYRDYRDNTLITPVPSNFIKSHLDLINVYHAMYMNITAMAEAETDPVVTLVRLKRYEDDTLGLRYAIENIYDAFSTYSSVFAADDPAIFFARFYQFGP